MKGTRTKTVGNISINAITPEARELVDKLCEAYEKVYGKKAIDDEKSAYSVLYWAVRYSGLIGPNVDDEAWEDVNIYLRKKLPSFGCPDSYISRTADSMTNTIRKILKEKKVPSDAKKS